MLDFCPNSVSTATFPGQGYPFFKKKNSRFKTFEEYLDSLVIEEDQKFLKDVDTARVIAQLGYRFDMISLPCDLIPQVWHDVLDCNLIPQVFRQNTLRGGVPTAERRNRCFKKLWQGSERGPPWKVEIVFCWKQWYDVGVNLHVSKHFLTILEQKWAWLLLYSHVYSKQSYESPKALHSISVFVERLVQLLSHFCVLTC